MSSSSETIRDETTKTPRTPRTHQVMKNPPRGQDSITMHKRRGAETRVIGSLRLCVSKTLYILVQFLVFLVSWSFRLVVAERVGFEPTTSFPVPAFQASALG